MNRAGYGMIDEETKQRMEKGVQEALSYITKEWSNTLWDDRQCGNADAVYYHEKKNN